MLRTIDNPEELAAIGNGAYTRTAELYARPIMLENLRDDYIKLLESVK